MSNTTTLQKAADEARKGARAARELGGYLDNYAKYLTRPNGRERAKEMHVFALSRLNVLNEGLATCDKWVIESDKFVFVQAPEQVIPSEVGETQVEIELSKPRAFRIKRKESQK